MSLKNQQSGFTIVEIIVGLVVTSIFVLGLTVLITSLNVLNDRARDLALTNGLVENKVESLRSADFVALVDETIDFSDELPGSLGKPGTANYTVSTVNPSVKQVDVFVSYDEQGRTRILNYRSYIGELGVGQ